MDNRLDDEEERSGSFRLCRMARMPECLSLARRKAAEPAPGYGATSPPARRNIEAQPTQMIIEPSESPQVS